MATVISDTFTGADATDLAAHSPDVGGAWTEEPATSLFIHSNKLSGPTSSRGAATNGQAIGSADYSVTVDCIKAGSAAGYFGPVARWANGSGGSGYVFYYYFGDSNWYLSTWHNAAEGVLGNWLDTGFSTSRTAKLEVLGTSISGSVDGTVRVTATDTDWSAEGHSGVMIAGGTSNGMQLDNFVVDSGSSGPPPGTHIVSGRGNVALGGLEWLSTSIAGRPSILSNGMAEPVNYYKVGMLSWATANGAMVAYPVTRDLDLVHIPAGMDTLYYAFATGITATIVELASP